MKNSAENHGKVMSLTTAQEHVTFGFASKKLAQKESLPTVLQIMPLKGGSSSFAVVIVWHRSLTPYLFWSRRRPCIFRNTICMVQLFEFVEPM